MEPRETDTQSSPEGHWWPRAVAIAGGIGFIAPGVWVDEIGFAGPITECRSNRTRTAE